MVPLIFANLLSALDALASHIGRTTQSEIVVKDEATLSEQVGD